MPAVSDREFAVPTVTADPVTALREALLELDDVSVSLDPGIHVERASLQRAVGRHLPIRSVETVELEQRLSRPPTSPSRTSATVKTPPDQTELMIARAPLQPRAWGQEPSRIAGSCEGVLRDLGHGQESSLAELEPFLDWLDGELWVRYRAELKSALEKVPKQPAGPEACTSAYNEILEGYRQCDGQRTCRTAPRTLLSGALVLSGALPELSVPEGCEIAGNLAPLESAAKIAVERTLPLIDPRWSELADRMAALSDVHDALEDGCAPRRRHVDPAAMRGVARLLGEVEDGFNRTEPAREGRRWRAVDARAQTVPGLGRVAVLARFDSGRGSAAQRIRNAAEGLRTALIDAARCTADHPMPLIVVLTKAGAARTSYLGYHYRESLFCPGLDPL